MIDWHWPWLLLLAPLPLLVRRFAPVARTAQAALQAPFFAEWQQLAREQTRHVASARRGPLPLLWLIWLLLLAATARPTWIGEPVALPDNGRELLLAVDISGSMRVEDMMLARQRVRRIDAVKQVAGDFIQRRTGDRLGLILFGSQAYLQSPLTFDIDTVARFLDEAQVGFAGNETAIGDAIGLAVKRLRERPADSRVLVLLTDGQDTASSVRPLEAARLAANLGIRIHTIGIGADAFTVRGPFGSNFGARQVNPATELDETLLRDIARVTQGQYFRARDPQELADIYALIDQIEPVKQDAASYRPRTALGYWPLTAALLLSFALALQRGRLLSQLSPGAAAREAL